MNGFKLTEREEIIFSQGMFVEKEIKGTNCYIRGNSEEKIIAFLNIIPDYVKNEGTYDLLRKTADAPTGLWILSWWNYSNISKPMEYNMLTWVLHRCQDLTIPTLYGKSMKFAYENPFIFSLQRTRDYKDKFNRAGMINF